MFRRGRRIPAAAVALACAWPASAQPARGELAPGAGADRRVEQFLSERGLLEPLSAQLEARLASAPREDRVAIAERLAAVYVALLTRAATGAERSRWEQAGRALLASVPEADSLDLRLDLHRAAYARAEEIAERWRVGLATPAEREEALASFASLERELAEMGKEADRRVVRLQRDEERGGAGDLLSQHLAGARRQRSFSMYLAGWCNTYLADLTGAQGRAEEALRQFGWLLGAETGRPATLRRLSRNFLRYEHIARSALGVAVCSALLERPDEAVAWLDAVEGASDLPDALRAQAPVWRMVVLARLNQWSALEQVVAQRRAAGAGALGAGEARLVATLALRAPADQSRAGSLERLRDGAVADLVRRGELAAVVELGREHGPGAFGLSGFVSHCVRGLLAFEQASEGAGEQPGESATLYGRAAQSLADALRAPDAESFPGAAGEVVMTLGLARFALAEGAPEARAARFLSAAESFEQAAQLLGDTDRAGEAVWMAIRALDSASEAGGAVDARRRRALVETYLDRFPTSPRAGMLLLAEAVDGDASPEETVARLEAIPPGGDAYDAARRHIARLLYDLFRDAPEDQRDWAARRYADAAEPLLADDLRAALAGDGEAAAGAASRARRLVAALVSATPIDASRALRALDALRRLIDARLIEGAPLEREIRYRDAQIAVARDDLVSAEGAMAILREEGAEGGAMADSLARSIYRAAVRRWREAQRGAGDLAESARRVATVGQRLLDDPSTGADGATRLAVEAGVAEAWHDLWRAGAGAPARDEALRRHGALADRQVNDPALLRRLAALAEGAGDIDRAIDAWRTLGAGIDRAQPEWFETRWELIRLIADHDHDRALALLDQHAILYPDYGPAPWGDRLRAMHETLDSKARDGAK